MLLCSSCSFCSGAFEMYYRWCQSPPQLDQLIVVLCSKLFLKTYSLPPWVPASGKILSHITLLETICHWIQLSIGSDVEEAVRSQNKHFPVY